MNFDLDEQQLMLRDLVARFAGDRYDIEKRSQYRRAPEGFSTENWALLAELGILALPFAEVQGGIGGGPVDIITVAEELGRGLCGEPWLSEILMAGRLLERAGDDAQRQAWLGPMMAGTARLALAHVEERARYNPHFVTTEARDGALTGAKTFVLGSEGVSAFLVSARESGAPADPAGIGIWIVPADAAGLERRSYRLTDGSVACELRLHNVRGCERLPGDGAEAIDATFDDVRIAACAEMVGIMAMLMASTLDYLRTRNQFGQPIGSFQAIQHRMAQLYVGLEQSRSHLLRAALAPDDGSRPATIAGAKAFVSERAIRMGEECIQLHGGMGVSDELAIGHGHKRILVLANLFGDHESELARYIRLVA